MMWHFSGPGVLGLAPVDGLDSFTNSGAATSFSMGALVQAAWHCVHKAKWASIRAIVMEEK